MSERLIERRIDAAHASVARRLLIGAVAAVAACCWRGGDRAAPVAGAAAAAQRDQRDRGRAACTRRRQALDGRDARRWSRRRRARATICPSCARRWTYGVDAAHVRGPARERGLVGAVPRASSRSRVVTARAHAGGADRQGRLGGCRCADVAMLVAPGARRRASRRGRRRRRGARSSSRRLACRAASDARGRGPDAGDAARARGAAGWPTAPGRRSGSPTASALLASAGPTAAADGAVGAGRPRGAGRRGGACALAHDAPRRRGLARSIRGCALAVGRAAGAAAGGDASAGLAGRRSAGALLARRG